MIFSLSICLFNVQVKETVRALKDSESGLEKMAIGHHIQDRGHVVEKKMNKKTGDKELVQDFQNMDECGIRVGFNYLSGGGKYLSSDHNFESLIDAKHNTTYAGAPPAVYGELSC